jgi:DNA-3-methyladenine glycosylase
MRKDEDRGKSALILSPWVWVGMKRMKQSARLQRKSFSRPTLDVARMLLGKRLVKLESESSRTSGLIIETEAYVGTQDLGCHARAGKTARNASMWGAAGHAYVYFIYGMHWMFNIVTEHEEFPAAVLIRALFPQEGLERIRQRRSRRSDKILTDGPAKICQALGIDRSFDGMDLCEPGSQLFIERGITIPERDVTTGPRVGFYNVPEPWMSMPWRFRVVDAHIERIGLEEGQR